MRYILKTELNSAGNKVFSKKRQGKSFVYLAKDETGKTQTVDKNWIVKNAASIVNVGVSGENIYPKELKKSKPASVRVERIKSYALNPLEYELFKIARNHSVVPTELFYSLNDASYSLNNSLAIMIPAFYHNLVDNVFLLTDYYEKYLSGKCKVVKRDFTAEELGKIETIIAFSYAGIEDNIFDEMSENIKSLNDIEEVHKLKATISTKALELKILRTITDDMRIFASLPEKYFDFDISDAVTRMLYVGKCILFNADVDYDNLKFCRKHFNAEELNRQISGLIVDKIIKINMKNGVYDEVLKNTKIKVSH